MSSSVMALRLEGNNADLIADCFDLGYLADHMTVLDPTWGLGRFWTGRRPRHLIGSDIDPERSPTGTSVDFRCLPHKSGVFDAVVFDGPYKLNGTGGSHASDAAYGVADAYVNIDDRHQLIRDGMTECARVLRRGGHLLVKCQDQVSSGRVRWQTRLVADHGEALGCWLVDRLELYSYRPQPPGRSQRHARRCTSSLLVFRKEAR